MPTNGALTWLIPDAYLAAPADNDEAMKNHEAVCILNVSPDDARLKIDFYFEAGGFVGTETVVEGGGRSADCPIRLVFSSFPK